jgi:predicted xylose isomerase-like sugar epimerase
LLTAFKPPDNGIGSRACRAVLIEPFSPAVHALEDPARALAGSIAFIRARL